MTTEKLAVSIPAEILARARKSAKREKAPSLSAYVSAALEQKSTMDDLAHLLDELLAQSGGPLTAAERRAADKVLLKPTAKRRRA
jgi:alkylhydroperoxidase/carboxymuconolactone decarboxylase family protein YurZ